MNGAKGDKGDLGLQGLKGSQVLWRLIYTQSRHFNFQTRLGHLVFAFMSYRVIKESQAYQETKGRGVRRCGLMFYSCPFVVLFLKFQDFTISLYYNFSLCCRASEVFLDALGVQAWMEKRLGPS